MSESKRRFIAGATCPACGQVDKLVLYYQDGVKVHECVRCGYKKSELEPPPVDADQHEAGAKALKSRPQVIQWFKPDKS
ncbi:MAG: YheV family putative metal-binding protein [Gammaproteobacteria bacterium]|nr:YheV family putative metal-binding protein [Gammaproteobacteria bacterium]